MKKLVIFDMDGLMFDSERLAGNCLIEAGKQFGYDIPWETRLELLGKSKETNSLFLQKEFGKDFPVEEIFELSRKYRNEYIQQNGIEMKKGLIELLEYLKEKKVMMVVASSSTKDTIKQYLQLNDLCHYFNAIVSGDMVSRCKPDPEIFLKACKEFDIDPSEAIVLEDSLSGIMAAFHGNIEAIVVPDLVKPDEKYISCTLGCFNDLSEVKNYFEEQNII